MTPINASSNGYNTTLSVCREHLNDAYSAILSARDMGGDVLYEVKFDSVGTKKLMATFAKLTKI